MLRAVASLGRVGVEGFEQCQPPMTYSEASMKAYGMCAGEEELVDWAVEHGLDPALVRKAYHGDLEWRDAVRPYLANQGFHGDPTSVIRDDGTVDWKEAAGQGGAFAAYAACASDPATAPLAPLCSEGGYYGGKALYALADKGYSGLKDLDFWNWGWGGTKPTPKPYNVPTARAEIIGIIAREYRDKGYLDYLMNMAMLQGVAYQYYALARSIEVTRQARGLRPITGEQALTEAGYAPPIGYTFLLSGTDVTPPPPVEPHGRWWTDHNLLEHELLQGVSGDVPAPKLVMLDLPQPTYDAGGMVRDADFTTFSIEHTNQAFLVRCAGWKSVYGNQIGLPKRADGTLPKKSDPLFKTLRPSPIHGDTADSGSCFDKYVSVRARVYFDPHVRSFCDRSRNDALALKDVMLILLQQAADRAIFNALNEQPPLALSMGRTLAPSASTILEAEQDRQAQCSSYTTYLGSNTSDLVVAALLAGAGALAGKMVPKVGGTAIGAAAGAVVGISYLMGSRSTWKKNNGCR